MKERFWEIYNLFFWKRQLDAKTPKYFNYLLG